MSSPLAPGQDPNGYEASDGLDEGPDVDPLECQLPGCHGHGPIDRVVDSLDGVGFVEHEDGRIHAWNHRSSVKRRKPVDFKRIANGTVVPVDGGSRRRQQIEEFAPALNQLGPVRYHFGGHPADRAGLDLPELPGYFKGVAEKDVPGRKPHDVDKLKHLVNTFRQGGESSGGAIELYSRYSHLADDIPPLTPERVRDLYYKGPVTGPQQLEAIRTELRRGGPLADVLRDKHMELHELVAELRALVFGLPSPPVGWTGYGRRPFR